MAERITPNTVFSAEEILRAEIMVNLTLIDILIARQIISEDELTGSIQNIKQEQKILLDAPNKVVSFKR